MQLDENKDMIKKQRNLLNHLQVLNEINQGDMTYSGTELSKVNSKKEQLAMKINEQVHDQKRVLDRHDRLTAQIHSFKPVDGETEEDWMNKRKKDFVFLPEQHTRYPVKSSFSIFDPRKMPNPHIAGDKADNPYTNTAKGAATLSTAKPEKMFD